MGYYSSGWSLVLIGLAESMLIGWVYGAKQLMKDIEDMVGFKLRKHWWVCWTFVTPVLLIVSALVLCIVQSYCFRQRFMCSFHFFEKKKVFFP